MLSSFIGKVLDNYRIIESLGIGGMGVVFKAIHIKLDKLFALKMIAPGLTMNETFIKRFQTESKALAKFEDPNIVRIYDLRADNDQWFIVMEYVEGVNLLEKIKKDGAFRWQEALPILKQMLAGIGHAHAAGIIHRDIKPNNIMITEDHVVKITDFGLAKDQTSLVTTMSLTSGGTLYYMSPEHVKGISFTEKRSDIYSIGMTFYEMIAGCVPFKDLESDFDIRETIVRKKIAKPSVYNSDIPPLLETIVMKSIAKDPDDRYQSTNAMLEAILGFEEKFPIVNLAQEILPERSARQEKKSESANDNDGPDTRFEKALKKQTKDFLRRYGIVAAILMITILVILTYLLSSDPEKPKATNISRAEFNITSTPSGVLVHIDNESVGTTPLNNFTLQPGSHRIRLDKSDYESLDTLITLRSAIKTTLSFDLRPVVKHNAVPNKTERQRTARPIIKKDDIQASLYASSDPVGATIWIDDVMRGKTPLQVDRIDTKPHKIRIEKDGYQPYVNNIELEGGKTSSINAKLALLSGGLRITTIPENAIIKIDGQEINGEKTPALLRDIPVGQHKIEITKVGYNSVTKDVQIEQDMVENLMVELVRLEGKLAVQVRPWGYIYLNNELQKASSDIKYQVDLPVEMYQIKVVHPTLGKWVKSIQIEPNEKLKIVVDFNRKHTIKVLAVDESGNPLNALVFIDDKDTEKSTPADLQIRTGIHRLIVKKDGYHSANGEKEIFVDIDSGKSHKIVLKKIE